MEGQKRVMRQEQGLKDKYNQRKKKTSVERTRNKW